MARTESVVTVFLASPGDVTEERNRLEEVVLEGNRTWARDQALRLELLRWEVDAIPGIGIDAQDVVNQQIPNDCALFVGVMWSRFGTPTARAGSGTAEEFDRALARHRASPDDVNIFFYFKDAPVPPSKVDPVQLQQVQAFKKNLTDLGVLHWEFVEPEQFEKLVALHIARFVQSWRQRGAPVSKNVLAPPALGSIAATHPAETAVPAAAHINDDPGLLDLPETFEARSAEVNEIAGRLTAAQQQLTERTERGTADLQALATSPTGTTAGQARKDVDQQRRRAVSVPPTHLPCRF